jgi:uncharacterized membrane protein YuzA (DUF378 family)
MANKMEMVEDWLLAIGGVNWGLGLIGGFNLVTWLGGLINAVEPVKWVAYLAIGLSGLHKILLMTKVVK